MDVIHQPGLVLRVFKYHARNWYVLRIVLSLLPLANIGSIFSLSCLFSRCHWALCQYRKDVQHALAQLK